MADRESVIRDLRYVKTFGRVSNTPHLTEIAESALELLREQQHEIWELQELNEHLADQQKKIRMFVDSKCEVHPLEPEPVEPKEEENSNNLHGSFWTCGKCGQAITVSKGFVRYCWNCGTPVKWGG